MDPVFEALAHPTRRRILEMLRGGGLSAGTIAEAFDVSRPTMSAHFAKLKAAELIQAEPQGTTIIYTLNLSMLEQVVMGFMTRLGVGEEKEGASCRSVR
jgi:DNA-binding transcriptional ArsR family regulator